MAQRCFTTAATAATPPVNPSLYVSRLRRAFLLRAHPDRFRSYPRDVRRQQANLVHAISERMASPDFIAYKCGEAVCSSTFQNDFPTKKNLKYHYVLEKTNGILVNQSIQLDDTVVNVLTNMANALSTTGSIHLPPPPSTTPEKNPVDQWMDRASYKQRTGRDKLDFDGMHGIIRASARRNGAAATPYGVDTQFDVNTYRGRDLLGFLKTMDPKQIEERKASRVDATAAALVVRRAFQFQSVDGTRMGWSSASLARCLISLMALYEEHHLKFNVPSFYPLRLVISADEFLDPIDVYGGILRLNTASTTLQWLETIRLVTPDKLQEYRLNQTKLQEFSRVAQGLLGVKLKKGLSCSSEEYHDFLAMLVASISSRPEQPDGAMVTLNALVLERIIVTVESSHACRRGLVNRDGSIRVGAGMLGENILSAISRLTKEARTRLLKEREKRDCYRQSMTQVQCEFGLERVYRAGMVAVTADQLLDCLTRLLASENEKREEMKYYLAGNSLGIAGAGQFCHFGDDGSVVIPWDWR